jgi:pimeloyl-ACP methyl ester carboxylesterase
LQKKKGQTMLELPPLHVSRPYGRPRAHLSRTLHVMTPDGASLAAFLYAPAADDPVRANSVNPAPTPVLMLHGNGEEHGIFGAVINALVSCGRPALALDSRAQGRSTRGAAPLSYELMAKDAMRVLEEVGIPRAHVLGFSDGAIEGLLLARDWAEHVVSLTALGANLNPDGLDGTDDILQAARANAAWATRSADGPACYPDGTPAPSRAQAATAAELLYLMVNEPHIEAASLKAIACPVSVVAGEHDDIPRAQTDAIAQAIPDARELIVPGADHTLPKVAPEAVLRELLVTIARAEA